MTEKNLTFELTGDDSIIVDFDNDPNHTAKYQIGMIPQTDEKKDKLVLSLNKPACRAFARLFAQLAEGEYSEEYHFHLSLTEKQQKHTGLRIVLKNNGRIDWQEDINLQDGL